MNVKADPAPLGLAAFAMATWLLGMLNAGWYSMAGLGLVYALALAFGGGMQIVAGMMEYGRGNTFGTTAFLSYGAFWWTLALAGWLFAGAPHAIVAWLFLLWGVLFFYLWLAAVQRELGIMLVFLGLWITFILLAIGAFSTVAAITHLGGYAGLATAILAFYASAAQLLNSCYGRTVLPFTARS